MSASPPDNVCVLLVRFNSLGDVVKCTAIPRLLKKRWPQARVIFATLAQHAPLLANHPQIDEVACYHRQQGFQGLLQLAHQLRRQRPQLAIDLHNSLRSRLLRLLTGGRWLVYNKRSFQRWLLAVWGWDTYPATFNKQADFLAPLLPWGVQDDGRGTEIHPQHLAADSRFNKKFASEIQWIKHCRSPLLGAAPVAAWHLKRWPLNHMKTLLQDFITQCGGKVMLFGGADEPQLNLLAQQLGPSALNLAGRTNLLESAWFASQTGLMVANDTGMAHIAEAVGVDTLVLFGPTTEHWGYFPQRPSSRVLQHQLPCRPCTRTGKGNCHHPWQKACLDAITPQIALKQVRHMLNC